MFWQKISACGQNYKNITGCIDCSSFFYFAYYLLQIYCIHTLCVKAEAVVENWSSMVEHFSHIWRPLGPLCTHLKWSLWSQRAPKTAIFCHIRPFLAKTGLTCIYLVGHFGLIKNGLGGGWEGPHIGHFLARFGHTWPETDRIYIYGRCCTSCSFLIFRVILFKACNFSLEED